MRLGKNEKSKILEDRIVAILERGSELDLKQICEYLPDKFPPNLNYNRHMSELTKIRQRLKILEREGRVKSRKVSAERSELGKRLYKII